MSDPVVEDDEKNLKPVSEEHTPDLSLRAMLRAAGVPSQHIEAAVSGCRTWLGSWNGIEPTANLMKRIGYGQ